MFCDKCKQIRVLMATGRCTECPGGTKSISYKLCAKCSKEKQECAKCRTHVEPDPFDLG